MYVPNRNSHSIFRRIKYCIVGINIERIPMTNRQSIHIALLLWGSIFCLLAFFCMHLSREIEREKKKYMLLMLFSSAVLLASDAVACGFRGSPGRTAWHMVLISNFFVFLFSNILLLIYHGYVCCWIFEKDPEEKRKNRRVNTVYAICAAAILLVCISQITHLYYYIDTQNYYHRNPGYYISILLPMLGMLLDLSLLLQLKGKQDYGHQTVAVMLSCNGIVLNYAFVMYNKSDSKIDLVQNIARELLVPPVMSYFLCDCWYISEKIINTFARKGFHTIGALKTNRMLYPFGIRQKLSKFAALLSVTYADFHLVTVKKQKYYVYRYGGKLNGIENAVVLLSYPEKAFGKPKALRAFLSTDVSLSTDEILSYYVCRWPIEVFFRQCKDKLALDSYQIRSAQEIRRYWLIMSLAHYMCVIGNGESSSFENGYRQICDVIQLEKYRYIFQCAKASNDFDAFMKLAILLCAIF